MKFGTDKHKGKCLQKKVLRLEEKSCWHADAGAHFRSAVRMFCGLFISCSWRSALFSCWFCLFIANLKVFNIGTNSFFLADLKCGSKSENAFKLLVRGRGYQAQGLKHKTGGYGSMAFAGRAASAGSACTPPLQAAPFGSHSKAARMCRSSEPDVRVMMKRNTRASCEVTGINTHNLELISLR